MAKYPTTPAGWFADTIEPFDWSGYLQGHLVHAGVRASLLHPVAGLRWAAFFTWLQAQGRFGQVQMLSATRTYAEQTALYRQICLTEHRCGYVANPDSAHGPDTEGVERRGSNHQAQRQPWGADCGYAVDLATSIGWDLITAQLNLFGLRLTVLSPFEPWHFEPCSRSAPWFAAPALPNDGFPATPGIYRPLSKGLRGGDVAVLQRQLGAAADGQFGPSTEAAVTRAQHDLGRPTTGVWSADDQRAHAAPPGPDAEGLLMIARKATRTAGDAIRAVLLTTDGDGDPVETELRSAAGAIATAQRALGRAQDLAG